MKLRSAQVGLVVLGILAIIFSIKTTRDYTNITYSLLGFAIAIIGFIEISVIRLWKQTKLKRLTPAKYLTLTVYFVVLLNAILSLPSLNIQIPILSGVATGTYLTGGVLIILEAFSSF